MLNKTPNILHRLITIYYLYPYRISTPYNSMSAAHVICVSAYPENHKMESMKMIAIFTGLLFLSLSYLFQVNCNNDCDCKYDKQYLTITWASKRY